MKKNKKKEKSKADSQKKTVTPAPNKNLNWLLPIGILLLTFISFFPSLSNGYVLWDDPEYIINNPYTKAFDLKSIFSNFYMGNYHPLTLVSYCLENKFFGTSYFATHLDNLLLHLVNTLLVFVFTHQLLGKKKIGIAAITATLFGIHPMHVESVAWMAERKDVLYTFFYLAAMIAYLRYVLSGRKISWLIFTFVLSLLSLLAKGQAVSLPLIFLLIDYFLSRKFSLQVFVEKIPFFILSSVFGYLAIKAQGAEEAINENYYSGFSSLFFGSYGLVLYLFKFFVPIHLSGLHPYPLTDEHGVPKYIYAAVAIIPVLLFIIFKTYKTREEIAFGILFFLFAIAPMLKFLPVGDTIIGERYSYISYIGLFFIVGYFFDRITAHINQKKYLRLAQTVLIAVVITLSITTYARTKIWKDTKSFWSNVVEQYPNYWRGWNCLAQEYYQDGDYKTAYAYYNNAILNDKFCPPIPYLWRGAILLDKMDKADQAVADFKRVISMSHSPQEQLYKEAALNLGLAYIRMKDYYNAHIVYKKLALTDSANAKLFFNTGLIYVAEQKNDSAAAAYQMALKLDPEYTAAWLNLGVLYTDFQNRFEEGIAAFEKVLQLQPDNADAPLNIAVTYYKMGKLPEALRQYNAVLQTNPNEKRAYYFRALVYVAMGDYVHAIQDGEQARRMGMNVPDDAMNAWKMNVK